MHRRTHFDNIPIKPQRVYEEMNKAFGPDTRYVSTIGLSQIAAAQFLHVYKPRHWINAGQAGPLGWTLPATLGVCVADPDATVVALSGDYDFQFMMEELAVGAQFNLPYIHVLVNNAYLGPDPPIPTRLRHGLLRATGVRQHQHRNHHRRRRRQRDRRVRRGPRQTGRGHGRQGAAGDRPRGAAARPGNREEDCSSNTASRCWSRSSWNASPTSRWAWRSTTWSSSRNSPSTPQDAPTAIISMLD